MQLNKENTDTQHPAVTSRRSFLNRVWALLGILACFEFAWLGISTFSSRRKRQQQEKQDSIIIVGSMDNFTPKTVTAIPQGQFYLACLEDGSFLALSRTCTHLGCSVPWDEEQGKFVCPCHGSTFSLTGEVMTSPAPRPLDTYPVRIENRIIKVNISQLRKRDRFEPSQATRVA
ncbi:MAG: ubiquinol-cytochrome c reductase iron-sulfur subunit [Desulfobulbaceae bacterium]|nr:ubiquinol-cytochrome c reductase iron-sulfur subunit [Desulfobulbaceae bacterium]